MWNRYAYVPIFGAFAGLSGYIALETGGFWWVVAAVCCAAALLAYFWSRRIYQLTISQGVFVLSDWQNFVAVDPGSLVEVKPGWGFSPSLLLKFSPPTPFGPVIRVLPFIGGEGSEVSDVELYKAEIWAVKGVRQQAGNAM